MTTIPRLSRASSALKVVGPLAASTNILHYSLSAFSNVTVFSTAAKTRMSQGFSRNDEGSVADSCSAKGNPLSVPLVPKNDFTWLGSRPSLGL